MAVIPFPNLSPQGPNPSMSWELRSITARQRSPLAAGSTTLERPGAEWAAAIPYENLYESSRGRLQAFSAMCRGHGSRFYLRDFSRLAPRGSFPATELLTNGTFANGTTGWAASNATIAAQDGRLIVKRSSSVVNPQATQTATVAQYAPHVLRGIFVPGRGGSSLLARIASVADGSTASGGGRSVLTFTPLGTTAGTVFYENTAQGVAGDFFGLEYASLSRCALVDNGPNQFTKSIELDHADWTKGAVTVSANTGALAAPDGTSTADRVLETSATDAHLIYQTKTKSAVAQDWCITAAVHIGLGSNPRSYAYLLIDDNAGNAARCIFNVSAGTAGTPTLSGTYTNARATITSLGNGWYQCALVATTNTATDIYGYLGLSSNGTLVSYAGDTNSDLVVWRMTLAQSSVPVQLIATTTAATSGASQTGSALRIKGLPVSTNGLLLVGDWVEIITATGSELKKVTAALDSDGVGLGYLQFEPPMRNSPADGAAVIVFQPMARMMLDTNVVQWGERAAGFSDAEFRCVEDIFS